VAIATLLAFYNSIHSCGTETIYSGFGSDFGKVSVPVPDPDPDIYLSQFFK
jgi:hypothetical protein